MWTYIKHDSEAEKLPGQPSPPAEGTVYRAFDALRWKQVIGYTETGIGCASMLDPNVNDDCQIIAFASLDEPTQPDETKLREAWPLKIAYPTADVPILLFNE
jgi:hypothetical protein